MSQTNADPEPIVFQCTHKGENFLFLLKDETYRLICKNCYDLFVGLNKDNILYSWNFKTGEKLQ